MIHSPDDIPIRQALAKPSGRDFLPSLPLFEAQFASTALIHVLRRHCTDTFREIEERLSCDICLIAFGSLGRSEFVMDYSDLDPLIIVEPKGVAPSNNIIRDEILRPLIESNHWVKFDDDELIRAKKWHEIKNVDLKYPVYQLDQLTDSSDEMANQRRWQILLESTCLYRERLFVRVVQCLTPKLKPQGKRHNEKDHIDFVKLIGEVPTFFASFENPKFLYKDPHKYWKTRFLRDFYKFANMLNLLLGYYLYKQGQEISLNYLSGSTAIKIVRTTKFADQLDDELKSNETLGKHYKKEIASIMRKHGIDKGKLLSFGDSYNAEPARLLHGLLMCVLSRFAACWEAIYDENVRSALDKISETVNFDAAFPSVIKDVDARRQVEDLMAKRDSYLKYMAAGAEVIDLIHIKGGLIIKQTGPSGLHKCLKPFIGR